MQENSERVTGGDQHINPKIKFQPFVEKGLIDILLDYKLGIDRNVFRLQNEEYPFALSA